MKIFRLALIGIVILILGIWLGSDYLSKPLPQKTDEFPTATVLQVPIPIFQISLTDHNQKRFTVRRFARNWTFMFFGYTHCPDVCPMALVDLNDIYHKLEEVGELVEKKYKIGTQFVFVTVDPQRDTVEELKEYILFFNDNFIGLTAKPDMIAKLAHPLGIAYSRVRGEKIDDDYLVDHSASFLLIDPLGRMRATFPPPHNPEQIVTDFLNIRNKYTEECCITSDKEFETTIFDYRKKEK